MEEIDQHGKEGRADQQNWVPWSQRDYRNDLQGAKGFYVGKAYGHEKPLMHFLLRF
jgi:hypothetical protein